MTHEEVRALLPAYAAGALDASVSEAVRGHIAGGCVACLDDVFARPVGLPRASAPEPEPVPPPRPVPPPYPSARERPSRTLVVAVVTLAAALGATVAWMVVELRGREAALRAEATKVGARLKDAEAARAALAGRVETLEREVAAARADATRTAEAAREGTETEGQVREELGAARERIATLTAALRRRERELERLRPGAPGGPLRDLLAAPGLEILRLDALPPFRDARGHALWRPGAPALMVYAFDLPPLPGGSSYRLRVTLDDNREVATPAFGAGSPGEASVPIPLDGTGNRPRVIEVLLQPSGRGVLGWRR